MKPFKSLLTLIISVIICSTTVSGQMRDGQQRFRELESQRIAFITKEVSLTPAEAQLFWPVYNEYNEKRAGMMQKHRQERNATENLDGKSDSEILKIAEMDIAHMEEMTALRRQFHDKFLEVLPPIKVVKLYEAERNFNRELYRQNRQRIMQGQGRGRN
jgi:hypothetical protein